MFILELFHTIIISVGTWDSVILGWGNLQAIIFGGWTYAAIPVISGISKHNHAVFTTHSSPVPNLNLNLNLNIRMPLLFHSAGCFAQAFFAWRIYVLGRKSLTWIVVVGVIMALSVMQMSGGIAAGVVVSAPGG